MFTPAFPIPAVSPAGKSRISQVPWRSILRLCAGPRPRTTRCASGQGSGSGSATNTGYDTHRFATLEGRQIRTSAHVDTDRYTGYAPAGAAMTVTGDGTVVADAGAATSRIPAAGVRLSASLATSHETRAAEARSLSRHRSTEAGEARNAAVTELLSGARV